MPSLLLALVLAANAPLPPDPLAPMAPGGANARAVAVPPAPALALAELAVGDRAVRVPSGIWSAPVHAGAKAEEFGAYAVPAPVAALRGGDGVWFAHGYLETGDRLRAFAGEVRADGATLTYTFEADRTYVVELRVAGGTLLLDERSQLAPADRWVLDASVGWQPTSGAVFAPDLRTARHLVLPCFYDKAEALVQPARIAAPPPESGPVPAGLAVYRAGGGDGRILAVWARQLTAWEQPDALGFALWQHRQLPGRPDSRHPLGPETKSDATPNPRTADLLGPSLYEGHITLEFGLGAGRRLLALTLAEKGAGDELAGPLVARMQEHLP